MVVDHSVLVGTPAAKGSAHHGPCTSISQLQKEIYLGDAHASVHGIGAVLSQEQTDNQLHLVAYASRVLTSSERKYGVTELETLAVVWAISHYHHFLYGNSVTVYTDHTSVMAVLDSPNPTAKHARWWTRVYGQGLKGVKICYRAGRDNKNTDALFRSPHSPSLNIGTVNGEVQVATITSQDVDYRAQSNKSCLRATISDQVVRPFNLGCPGSQEAHTLRLNRKALELLLTSRTL